MSLGKRDRYGRAVDALQRFGGLSGAEAKLVATCWKREGRLEPRSEPAGTIRLQAEAEADESDDAAVLVIHGPIGPEWFGDETSSRSVVEQLVKLGNSTLKVRINSLGGDVFDGISIHNALSAFGGDVEVVIEGVAASAGAVVAAAGDSVEMGTGSMQMIHRAWGVMVGNADDAAAFGALLAKIDRQIADIFAESSAKRIRAGTPADEFHALMVDETWLSVAEAIEIGLADGEIAPPQQENAPRNAAWTPKRHYDRMRAAAMTDLAAAEAEQRGGK